MMNKCIKEPTTAKEYLNQAYELNRKANMIIQKSNAFQKSLYYSKNNDFAKIRKKIDEYEREVNELIDEYVDKHTEIENIIALINDPVQKEVLECRYLMYMHFESGYNKKTGKYEVGIDEETGYCARQVYRHYNKGLEKIEKILKERNIL